MLNKYRREPDLGERVERSGGTSGEFGRDREKGMRGG
jgi:hypothetical protein